jgi:hypothetical protein
MEKASALDSTFKWNGQYNELKTEHILVVLIFLEWCFLMIIGLLKI